MSAPASVATDAGADIVGMENLMKTMQDGDLNYDVVIASPDAMGVVGRLGQVLGPRGLMPNPKVGTVTPDVANAVKNAKAFAFLTALATSGVTVPTFGLGIKPRGPKT